MKKVWSEDNILFLKEHYIKNGGLFCSKNLNIPIQSVRQKASSLHLKMQKERWSNEELEFLIKYYPTHKTKYCAKYLGRSFCAVKTRANRLLITNYKNNTTSKVCLSCYEKKFLSEFSPHKAGILGVQSKCKKCRAKWESNRKQSDKDYRFLHSIRNRIRIAIKNNSKSESSKRLLGCSIEFLRGYLENKFTQGMTWDNHGEWHIDHIKPCSSFDMSDSEQQKLCFHYTNLQPLWAKDNLSKGDKIV